MVVGQFVHKVEALVLKNQRILYARLNKYVLQVKVTFHLCMNQTYLDFFLVELI